MPDRDLGVDLEELAETAADFELEVHLDHPVAAPGRLDTGSGAGDARLERSARVDRLPDDRLEARVAEVRQGLRVAGGRVDEVAFEGDLQPHLGAGLFLLLARDAHVERRQRQVRVGGARFAKGRLEAHGLGGDRAPRFEEQEQRGAEGCRVSPHVWLGRNPNGSRKGRFGTGCRLVGV